MTWVTETKPLISVGDVIKNWEGYDVKITSVEQGRYGLRLTGKFFSGLAFFIYAIPELPGDCDNFDWYNWAGKGFITLPSGAKWGVVCFYKGDPRPRTVTEYDKAWEETLRLMAEERQEKPWQLVI